MRRTVPRPSAARLLACTALLAGLGGCAGFRVFLDDTHSPVDHTNRPIGNSENIRQVEGRQVPIQPLAAEPGNVWPGPVKPEPTLEDLAHTTPQTFGPGDGVTAPSIANLPQLTIPTIPHHLQPRPGEEGTVLEGPIGAGVPPASNVPPAASPQGQITPTTRGPRLDTRVPSGIPPANLPANSKGIVVPNGNGTSTVIAPDGTISTVPTPK